MPAMGALDGRAAMANEPTPTPPVEESAMDTEAGKKALAAERSARSAAEKRVQQLEKDLQAAQDKDKPDIERLTSERDAAAKKAADLELTVLRMEVASEKGLTAAQAKRLAGSNRDELLTDADELLTAFGGGSGTGDGTSSTTNDSTKDAKSAAGAMPQGRPRENLSGGGDPTTEPEETDPAKLAESIPRR